MKLVISENKIKDVIYSYIDKMPDFQNLKSLEDEWTDMGESDWINVNAIFFFNEKETDTDQPVFTYYLYPKNESGYSEEDLDFFPVLEIYPKYSELFKVFPQIWEDVFKKWFEDKFNLPIKNIIFL